MIYTIASNVSIHLPLYKRGIYLIKSSLTPLFQRGGLNAYVQTRRTLEFYRDNGFEQAIVFRPKDPDKRTPVAAITA